MTTHASHTQPRSLRPLFMTELWERFAYWSVQSLLVLFMVKSLLLTDQQSYVIFATFGGLLMATPVIGGYLADKYIGYVRSIIIGAILLATGYFLLMPHSRVTFYIALSCLVFGNGLLKPNISTLLGSCYKDNDTHRQSGFTLFYLGINIGSAVGIISCGIVAKWLGWEWAFALGGIAILVGLTTFCRNLKTIHHEQKEAGHLHAADERRAGKRELWLVLGLLILLAPLCWLLRHNHWANGIVVAMTFVLLGYLINAMRSLNAQEVKRLIVCIVLIIFSITFWAMYMQLPMSLTLYVSRNVDLHLLGFSIPPSIVFSLNGIFMMIFAPFLAKLWTSLRQAQKDFSFPTKFALGIILIGVAFAILTLGANHITAGHPASLSTVAIAYALQTLGELVLSPIGLAMVSLLAPKKLRGMMMGTFFFAIAGAILLSGQLAKIADVPKGLQKHLLSAPIYAHAFLIYSTIAIAVGLLLLFLTPALKRMLK